MSKILGLAATLLFLSIANIQAQEEATPDLLIHAGTLLAVPGEPEESQQSILISNGHIVSVTGGYTDISSLPAGTRFLDLSDQFVMPGLMDMHVHLTGQLSPNSRNEALHVTTSTSALRGVKYAGITLRAGFTTVRDLGAEPEAIYALRDAINDGTIEGPRVFAAGSSIAATGGHGDVDGVKAELLDLWTPDTICDGPYDCRRATRHAIKYGADWIKVTATGGVLSDTATGTDLQMTPDELEEIMQTAHALGVKVAAHAHGTDGINAALRAGVDSIDHGTFMDEVSLRLFRETGAWLVPTLLPGALIPAQMEGNPFFTEAIRAKANAAAAASLDNVRQAYSEGVNIAFGTDSAVTPHGMNAMEFALMVKAGMSEMDALKAATVGAATLLGQLDSLGTVEAGKKADIIAVRGNPLEDITVMESVSSVVQMGRVIKTD